MLKKTCGHSEYNSKCPKCRLFKNSKKYRNASKEYIPGDLDLSPCVNLQESLGFQKCHKCPGKKATETFGCLLHGVCAKEQTDLVKSCVGCSDYSPLEYSFQGEPIRDLAYHLYPVRKNNLWRWNVYQLLQRIKLFNGRRFIAIAKDQETVHPQEVIDLLKHEVEDFIIVENDPTLREVKSFPLLFDRVQTLDPRRCLLFAQGKGVTKPGDEMVMLWTQSLYELMMDYWDMIEKELLRYSCTGAFRWKHKMWPDESTSSWFMNGSWVWYRSCKLFSKPNWKKIDKTWWGIESYPGQHFAHQQSSCFCGDESEILYYRKTWDTRMRQEVLDFKKNHEVNIPDQPLPILTFPKGEELGNYNVVSVITENYVERARPFLKSLNKIRNSPKYIICHGFEPSEELKDDYKHLTFKYLEQQPYSSFNILQHGRWLDALPELGEDEVCLLSDADVIIQRDFQKEEKIKPPHNSFLAAFNESPQDRLLDEAARIQLKNYGEYGEEIKDVPVYNCGNLVMTVKTWRRLQMLYEELHDRFITKSVHRSRNQWLLNYCFYKLGFTHLETPATLHQHGHFKTPREENVMFRHAY